MHITWTDKDDKNFSYVVSKEDSQRKMFPVLKTERKLSNVRESEILKSLVLVLTRKGLCSGYYYN